MNLFQLLEGNAESMCGDLLFSEGSRFFIFELKASEDDVQSEWKSSTGKTKAIYAHLLQLVRAVRQSSNGTPDTDAEKFLNLSLRGHHIVYVSPSAAGVTRVNVWAEPYILLATRKRPAGPLRMSDLPKMYGLVRASNGDVRAHFRLTFWRLMSGRYRLAEKERRKGKQGMARKPMPASVLGPVGLSFDEFSLYLSYLAQARGKGDEDVKTVVMDDAGRMFSVVHDLSALAALLAAVNNPFAYTTNSLPIDNQSVFSTFRFSR